jgi:hypothetical protein
VKKPFQPRTLLIVFTLLYFIFSCKKVNEATFLGDDLVPEVDNINTFDTIFTTETDNVVLNDTTNLAYGDPVALGTISNDPEFGTVNASVYFQVSPASYGTYPFGASKDSILIDSVVLSLNYVGGYGDTNTPQTVRVYQIASNPVFNDTTSYPFSKTDFETTGAELGAATFTMSTLDDTVMLVHGDTIKVANLLHIRLDDALADRFRLYDTENNPATGAYHNDTLFKKLFNGFAIKADEGTGNGLAYFDLSSTSQTALTIFYRRMKSGGAEDTTELLFTHKLRFLSAVSNQTSRGGQANLIRQQRAPNWDMYLNNGTLQDDKLYIQSTPGGSAGYISIPGLQGFGNKLIHRAELIATRIPTESEAFFTAPQRLFMDKSGGGDSAFIFREFLLPTQGGYSYNFNSFGGNLRADQTYRFNVTSAVQDFLARDSANYRLRIYAPFKTAPLDPASLQALSVPVIPFPAYGRVVLAGGNYAEEAKRMRLRVIYSKL